MKRLLLTVLCASLLTGCLSSEQREIRRVNSGPDIGDIVAKLPDLSVEEAPTSKPTRADVMAAYNRVYGQLAQARENHAVGKRLADLEMGVAEDNDIEGLQKPYEKAIDLYKGLLSDEQGQDYDKILYQLSRAQDLNGDAHGSLESLNALIAQYPDSQYVPEARFRRAEIHFSAERYDAAAVDYAYVVGLGDDTAYLQNSRYMLGWAQFKQSNLEDGLVAFFAVVDDLLVAPEEDGIAAAVEVDSLSESAKELLEDSLRAVVLAIEYLDGPETLASAMADIGRPTWQHLVYGRLADSYFGKERYLDTVRTWNTYVLENPLDAQAPVAHQKMIDTLVAADFPSEVLPKQKEFVERFGIYSEFYKVHDDEVKAAYRDTLYEYLNLIAKHTHGGAQKLQEEEKDARMQFLAAAQWYEEFLATFPEDDAVPDKLFLLGEVYTEAREPMQAVAAYQRVVREYVEHPQAHEAGYAAILGLEKAVAESFESERELLTRLQIDAQIEFALLFAGDPRAPSVQADAADSLFKLREFEPALGLASDLLITWPDVAGDVRQTALLIVGHGHFELADFAAAEQAYIQLQAMPLAADVAGSVGERLLASIYKQGEAAEAEERPDDAVHHYLRLAAVDPQSELAVKGHYDAVAVLETGGQLERAASLLEELRTQYPDHELVADAGIRLATMYEQTENWRGAADELSALATSSADPEMARQSRFRAAELYAELNEQQLAIEHFRDYAHTYKEPADVRFEAMQNLDELYAALDDQPKRYFWLKQKIALHAELGASATERMNYLAAHASFELADVERVAYRQIRLTHPLKKSLKEKQKALRRTVTAYEKVADYKVQDLATAATYQIADLYAQLSKSIMQSDRPANLSELELAQYDILLEEQAFPFEEQAISLHEINMRRSWDGVYDEWVKKSFDELRRLMPARFDKREIEIAYVETIH